MLSIVKTPNPVLTNASKDVKDFDQKLLNIIDEMQKTLLRTNDPKGVGLAAPQVGIALRIFLAKPNDKSKILTFINPQVLKESQEEGTLDKKNSKQIEAKKPKKSKGKLLEGCLSIPNIWGNVSRKKEITLKWQDEKGQENLKTFTGFLAVIIQHEMDHLNGTLFTKRVMEQNQKLFKSYKNEKGEDEFEEIKI